MKQKNNIVVLSLLGLVFSISLTAKASVTLLDQNEWKILISGFVETDLVNDSVRSFPEVIGNNPVDRGGTFNGENGRTQFSIRNSRLAFAILPPVQNDWKSKGYFEFDLLGYDPNASTSAPTNSEASFSTNPTLRVRHVYLSLENSGWSILSGQTWTLFGWQPSYVLTTASVPPAPGVSYQRTPEVIVTKKVELSDSEKIQIGASLARPSQRDSEMPNLDVGVRVTSSRRTSGFSSPSGEQSLEPMSLAISGTRREFAIPKTAAVTSSVTRRDGAALAVDLLLPILASTDSVANTLTLTGEYTTGSGYGDAFPGWSGNLAQMPAGTAGTDISASTNLDAGQGGFDAAGNFHLVKLQTWNAQLQYHFAWSAFMTLGYGELSSSNVKDFLPIATGKTIYDKDQISFVNYFHDFTKQVRVGVEYAEVSTHYIDGIKPVDHRYQISSFFRF